MSLKAVNQHLVRSGVEERPVTRDGASPGPNFRQSSGNIAVWTGDFTRVNPRELQGTTTPARHSPSPRDTPTPRDAKYGTARWGGPRKRGTDKPKQKYSEIARMGGATNAGGLESSLDDSLREVIFALHEYGEEMLPLATALRRLYESGELRKRAKAKAERLLGQTSPLIAVWPHHLVESYMNESEVDKPPAPITLDARPQTSVGFRGAKGGAEYDTLFRGRGGLTACLASTTKSIARGNKIPIDSRIEDSITAKRLASRHLSEEEAIAQTLDLLWSSSVSDDDTEELQRLLALTSAAQDLHPRSVSAIATRARSAAQALQRAADVINRRAVNENVERGVLQSLIGASQSELVLGLTNVATVAAMSLSKQKHQILDLQQQLSALKSAAAEST